MLKLIILSRIVTSEDETKCAEGWFFFSLFFSEGSCGASLCVVWRGGCTTGVERSPGEEGPGAQRIQVGTSAPPSIASFHIHTSHTLNCLK